MSGADMSNDVDGPDPQGSGTTDAVDQVKAWLTEQGIDPTVLQPEATARAERADRADRAEIGRAHV